MSMFDDREKGFEQKYKLDKELEFKAHSRRNRLLGLWVAEQLGLAGEEAETYAKEVVMADFHKPGDDDVIEKVQGDVQAKGRQVPEAEIRRRLSEFLEAARHQIMQQKQQG